MEVMSVQVLTSAQMGRQTPDPLGHYRPVAIHNVKRRKKKNLLFLINPATQIFMVQHLLNIHSLDKIPTL